mgnify:CR=1 FL=1
MLGLGLEALGGLKMDKKMAHCVGSIPCGVDDCFYCQNIPHRKIAVKSLKKLKQRRLKNG